MIDLCIMLVEDEEILRVTLEKILKREVREVHSFDSPYSALNAFGIISPDIIFTDIKMSGMDGLEMIARIREIDENIPVIVASAFSETEYFKKAIKLKIEHFLIKPIEIDELLVELERIEKKLLIDRKYAAQEKLLEEYKRIVDASNLVSKADVYGKITYVNDKFIKSSGYSEEELIGQSHNIVRHPDMESSFFKSIWETILAKQIWQGTIKNKNKSGESYYVETTIAPILDTNNEIIEFISVRTDVTNLVNALEEAQRLEKEKHDYMVLIDENIITSSTDLAGKITSASKAFCQISQYSQEELIGQSHRIVKHPDMDEAFYKEMWETLSKDQIWKGEIKNRAKDGTHYWVYATIAPNWDRNGKKIGYTAIRQDITDKKRVEELSVTDHLTGLYNRTRLDEIFHYEIPQSIRYGLPLSIIMVDIDHFKEVNDTYGHLTGDHVLKELSDILRIHERKTDTLGRWGGEEFLIILPKTDLNGSRDRAERIRIMIESHVFPIVGHKTASFGIAQLQENDTMASLIERADKALYRAKLEGRNRVIG